MGKQDLAIEFKDAATGRVVLTTRELASGSRPLELKVNGAVVAPHLLFPRTGAWTTWSTASVVTTLKAGDNTIRLTATGASGPNVDALTVGGQRYEAESATLTGARASNEHAGFSGAGYADFLIDTGAFVEWHVTVPADGGYPVDIRYANVSNIRASFVPAAGEHFAGLGHGAFGRVDKLDLRGTVNHRQRVSQSPLFVPFYLSSRGYGVFFDDTFPFDASFLATDHSVSAAGGALDLFVMLGPELPKVLDRYTELTGRPRLPPASAFGLGLSDKASSTGPGGQGLLVSSEVWWKDKIERMRAAGVPFDTVIHDNSWRGAKTGPWRWDLTRYPDPTKFASYCKAQGVRNMLDFNRADAAYSTGWQPSFRLPGTPESGERGGWPDVSRPEVRDWFWKLLFDETFDPKRGYPGDFLWLDEPDEDVTPTGPLGNGRSWDEMGSYYFFQFAKAIGEGWDRDVGVSKRPFVMSRGMTAGAQRWASLWSGDIDSTYDEMRRQIRGMLAAGISGFPFWAHDAGGFRPDTGPSVAMYRTWALAMGSFSPIWKPHGPGFRFPWDQYAPALEDARLYANLRMELLPYLYSHAHAAETTGMPLARPLFLEWPDEASAWSQDLEYLWGRDLLVAPDASDGRPVDVWLPPGAWYGFWDEARHAGARMMTAPAGKLPLFVRAGAIVPRAHRMASASAWDHAALVLDVYAGADGTFELVEDDGVSSRYRTGDVRRTTLTYTDSSRTVDVGPAAGAFSGAPMARTYEVRVHGLDAPVEFAVNGVTTPSTWDASRRIVQLTTASFSVTDRVTIRARAAPGTPAGDGGSSAGGVGPGDGEEGAVPGCACHAVGRRRAVGGLGLAASTLAVASALARRRRSRRSPS